MRTAVSGQRTEDRGQRTEDRGQRTEDRGQRTEDRGQRTAVSGQRTEDRGQQKTENTYSHTLANMVLGKIFTGLECYINSAANFINQRLSPGCVQEPVEKEILLQTSVNEEKMSFRVGLKQMEALQGVRAKFDTFCFHYISELLQDIDIG